MTGPGVWTCAGSSFAENSNGVGDEIVLAGRQATSECHLTAVGWVKIVISFIIFAFDPL